MLVWQQERHLPHKNWVLVCWWWWLDWGFARLIAPVVTTTSIILSSNKIQNGDSLVLAYPGPPGRMAIKMDRDFIIIIHNLFLSFNTQDQILTVFSLLYKAAIMYSITVVRCQTNRNCHRYTSCKSCFNKKIFGQFERILHVEIKLLHYVCKLLRTILWEIKIKHRIVQQE